MIWFTSICLTSKAAAPPSIFSEQLSIDHYSRAPHPKSICRCRLPRFFCLPGMSEAKQREDACSPGFVGDKGAQLEEGPGVPPRSVLTPDLCLVKELEEIFHGQSCAKCLC